MIDFVRCLLEMTDFTNDMGHLNQKHTHANTSQKNVKYMRRKTTNQPRSKKHIFIGWNEHLYRMQKIFFKRAMDFISHFDPLLNHVGYMYGENKIAVDK